MKTHAVRRLLGLSVALALCLGACAPAAPSPTAIPTQVPTQPPTATLTPTFTPQPTATASPTPEVIGQEVQFITEDGKAIAGTLYDPGGADLAVIFAHQGTTGADQGTWKPFARVIAGRGLAALTFDFRGRGKSDGPFVVSLLVRDLQAAIEFLDAQGFERIACVGASMGGSTCLALAPENDFAGLGIIASPRKLSATVGIRFDQIPELSMPKLFVCTDHDTAGGAPTRLWEEAEDMYNRAAEPKQLKIFPGTAHGTEIFHTEQGEEFRQLLIDFLTGLEN
jgi:pimeloyl-ACP methyl ester carboxylesterase